MEADVASRGVRERQRAETRERLYQAALDEIRNAGVAGAQVDRIVAAVGVARGTFYFHFPNKEDVLLEWERRREGEVVALVGGIKPSAMSLRTALNGIVTFLGMVASMPSERRLMLETLAIHVREMADPTRYPLVTELTRLIEMGRASGEVRDDIAPRALAILFLGNVFGFLVGQAHPSLEHPPVELLVDVFLSGVQPRPRSAGAVRSSRRKR